MFFSSMKRFLTMGVLITACLFEGSLAEEMLNELVDCSENYSTDNLKSAVFVSTLDGRITSLNAQAGGLVMWEVDTGPGPLLSSSIHKLELTNHGQWVRMIPSLSGALYKFNGVNLEMLPVSADHLLQSSSLLLNDGLVISGGRETRVYSIALETGELLYECSMKGCDNFKNTSHNAVVIQRHTQTVRAVDIHTGSERWNFSVGQHHVKLTTDAANCHMKKADQHVQDFDVKAIMPEGLVYAVEKNRPDTILWKHKFSSPIVSVWRLDHGVIYNVNLFHENMWSTFLPNSRSFSPILYLGMHQKQLYIQECVPSQNSGGAERATHFIENESVDSLQIPWDPFPVTSTALGLVSRSPHGDVAPDDDNDVPTTALSVLYASEYVNGNGYYIFNRNRNGSQSSKQCSSGQEVNGSDVLDTHELKDSLEAPIHIFIVPAWCWWVEVLVISVITAVLVNLIVTQRILQSLQTGIQQMGKKEIIFIEKPVLRDGGLEAETLTFPNYSGSANPQITEFTSRYLMDFEPIQCLGKGGFGVVFEAKNKIDDCNYAIKRIALPNSLESRDRVMREVKALAKLEHQHIVRYFNAWLECPPSGWQEHQDSVYLKRYEAESSLLSGATLSDETADSRYIKSGADAMENTSSIFLKKFDHVDDEHNRTSTALNDSYVVFEYSQLTNHEHAPSESADDSATNSRERRQTNCSLCSSGERAQSPRRMYLYIQMQLCLKESLREWLYENVDNRNRKTLLQMFEQIVQAVEYIHLKGLIHRDLKPSNIFFSISGEIKVGDFGLVTAIMPTLTSDPVTSVDMNLKHTAQVGTQLYMSPEQVQGSPYDYKVDIYSLGVILFELLYPFSTQMERSNVLLALRRNSFPEIFKHEFHDEYDLLRLMLSHKPEQRPTTFGIRARPPLSEYSSSKEPESVHSQWHFTLPLHSQNSSNPSFS